MGGGFSNSDVPYCNANLSYPHLPPDFSNRRGGGVV